MLIVYIIMLGGDNFEVFIAESNIELAHFIQQSDRREAVGVVFGLDEIMRISKKTWKEVTGLCVAYGKGSFTSNRIGAVTANTLSYIFDLPVLGFDVGNIDIAELKSSMIKKSNFFFSSIKTNSNSFHFVDPSYETPPLINGRYSV